MYNVIIDNSLSPYTFLSKIMVRLNIQRKIKKLFIDKFLLRNMFLNLN